MIPPIFTGQPVIIVGGGPSLSGFPFQALAGLNHIAINRAHEFCPTAQVLWWTDRAYWLRARESLIAHHAPFKATLDLDYLPGELAAGMATYRRTGVSGFDPTPGCIRHGYNSGYAAMHLAVSLGARRLILLGFDMCHAQDGQTHFDTQAKGYCPPETFQNLMLPAFATLAPELAARGVEVVNGSPNSALTIWPRTAPTEALAAYR